MMQRLLNEHSLSGARMTLLIFLTILANPSTSVAFEEEEQQMPDKMGVKIVFPVNGQRVHIGELTVFGTSTDDATTDCHIYVDWNDLKPFQSVLAAGPAREHDYSTWTFSYTKDYHFIVEGSNELTAKLFCQFYPINFTKYYTVNVMGIE
jgi:hypothetical protein